MRPLRRLFNDSVKVVTQRQMMPLYYRLAGKLKPLPITIPCHKQKGVVFSFDVETFPYDNVGIGDIPEEYSDFLPRLLGLLDSYSVKGHFFVSGRAVELYPDCFKRVVERGHCIGGHGYMHERMSTLSYDKQRDVIRKVEDCCKRLLGVEISTWRSPFATSNFDTYRALNEYGFRLSSSQDSTSAFLQIKDVLEVPYSIADGEILGYKNPLHWSKLVDASKKEIADSRRRISVLLIHTKFHMSHDPKLESMERLLSWLETRKEEMWIGSMDELLLNYHAREDSMR
ncbi:MAG: polysaccharide deacetylase family protein [Thaumarchaeota archaeon]|nr:polysaccharide deacetylase family protein [Nitrososphaerota archaeon]